MSIVFVPRVLFCNPFAGKLFYIIPFHFFKTARLQVILFLSRIIFKCFVVSCFKTSLTIHFGYVLIFTSHSIHIIGLNRLINLLWKSNCLWANKTQVIFSLLFELNHFPDCSGWIILKLCTDQFNSPQADKVF